MSSANKNLSSYNEESLPSAEKLKFGIVVSDWNEEITHALYEGCYDTLIKHGVQVENIHTVQVPGTFELPQGARILNKNRNVDATICIGCVIKGETSHNEYINMSVAQGLQNMAIASSKPFIFGVLTPNTMEQAKDRAGGKYGNKGVEAAVTALRMAGLSEQLEGENTSIGFGK
ncbi:6,7-dimethyl-8-ribityllumazine synthase [Aureispira anguillae]|uniref:6,7-dimethyl-8-ribityllumazine synthase n=1 Tax=Aureispira anguillae TaxID=2864201 RepID=A0A915YFK2_9BACT|nr:6,7-dimethyl-8-ribityllumazine synthase [Aureispira anguillae]BDS12109.1 6,7-dimethyl-8-ribityllumazine synthase [Aureispira anguillae]